MDILTYINKMNRLYGSESLAPWDKPQTPWWEEKHEPGPWDEQQVASAQFGTQGTYGAPEQIDIPNIPDLIREEGVQVGPQVKAPVYNTRKYFKPGGLVEPGVVHYGKKSKNEQKLKTFLKAYKGKIINKSAVAKQFGYKDKAAVDRLLKELGKTELLKSPHPLHGPSRKVIAELQSLPDGSAIKINELADKLDVDVYAVKTALKKPEIIKKNITTTSYGVDYLDNKNFKELFRGFEGSDRQFAEYLNTQTKYKSATGDPFSSHAIETRRRKLNLKGKNPNPFMVEGISNKQVLSEAKRLGVETKGVSLKELRRKTAQRRGDEAHRIKMKTDPEYVERYRKYKEVSQARIKADPELLERRREQQRAWARKYRSYGGIHHTKSPQGYLWRDLMDNATRYQYGRLPESHIKFKNPKQKFPTSIPKTEAVELIDTNVLDKKGKPKVITYDNVLEHINDNQRRYGMSSKDILNEYEKKIFIQQNPELRDQLNRKMYKAYDPSSPRQRAVFSPGHIHHTAGRGQNAFNVQFAPGTANLRENALRTKFKKDWQVAKTLSDKKAVTRRYLDAVPEDIEVRLKKVPYGTRPALMEQIKTIGGKDIKLTPEVKAQAMKLHSFPANLPEMAKMADPRKLPGDIAQLGRAAATKFPKTINFLKSIFGPVEMGTLPLFLAAEGAYGRYASERDFRKALERQGLDEKVINNLAEVYGRELADLGDVGLESYAIDQGEIPQTREFLKAEGVSPLEYQQYAGEQVKEERRTQAEEEAELYKKLYPEAQKEKYDPYAPMMAEGGRIGLKKGKTSFSLSRRGFLQWLLGAAGATVAAGTGLIKWGKVAGKGKTVIKAGDHIIQGTPGMPDWFIPLVNRIVKEGDDVTKKLSTIERETVHTAKIKGHDVDVYQNMDTGDIRVSVEGGTGKNLTAYDEGLSLEYKAGEVIESGKYRGKKTNPEFSTSETEAGYTRTGPDDAELDFGTYKQGEGKSISDTNFLKNYAKKKKTTLKEITETTKKKKQIKSLKENPHEDPRIPEFDDSGMDDMFDEFGNLIE